MTCEEYERLLAHSGRLTPGEEERLADHLAGCAACRADGEFLPRLQSRIRSLPPSVAPARDLWEGIAARLDGAEAPRHSRPAWLSAPMLAAAAVLLIILSSSATALLMRRQSSMDVQRMEEAYQSAAGELTDALNAHRTALGPQAVASVERSLHELDVAIADAKAALREHPGSQTLAALLRDTYQQKLDLLQRSAQAGEGS